MECSVRLDLVGKIEFKRTLNLVASRVKSVLEIVASSILVFYSRHQVINRITAQVD